jgi:hypothetical protein
VNFLLDIGIYNIKKIQLMRYNNFFNINCLISYIAGLASVSAGISSERIILAGIIFLGFSIGLSYFMAQAVIKNEALKTELSSKVNEVIINLYASNQDGVKNIIIKFLEIFSGIGKKIENDSAKIATLVNSSVMLIPFIFRNKRYDLLINYDGTKARKKIRYTMKKSGLEEKLKHNSGLAFLVSAEDMDAEEINISEIIEEQI